MRFRNSLLLPIAGALLLGAVASPLLSNAQVGAPLSLEVAALIDEVSAQQEKIVQNQVKIDEKLALIAEEARQARIYAGRGGR